MLMQLTITWSSQMPNNYLEPPAILVESYKKVIEDILNAAVESNLLPQLLALQITNLVGEIVKSAYIQGGADANNEVVIMIKENEAKIKQERATLQDATKRLEALFKSPPSVRPE